MTIQPSLLAGLMHPSRAPSVRRLGHAGVMTWNVQHAAAARAWRQAAWIAAQDSADIVILTEVPAGGDAHATALREYGYTTHCPRPRGDHRVLVATRLGDLAVVDQLYTGRLPGRLVAVRVRLPGGHAFGVVGLYVPSRGPREQRNVAKRAFQADVTAVLPTLAKAFAPATPVIVAGDLNVVEPGHQPHHAVFGAWEYDFYRAFAAAGLTDAFRHLHPDAAEHSWYGRAGRGYRFDHLFCATDHVDALNECRYLHDPREQELSDHSALAAVLRLPNPPA